MLDQSPRQPAIQIPPRHISSNMGRAYVNFRLEIPGYSDFIEENHLQQDTARTASNFIRNSYITAIEGFQGEASTIGALFPIPQFSKQTITQLCYEAMQALKGASALIMVPSQAYVVGDLNGSLPNLVQIFSEHGFPPAEKYIFLGNYINFGEFSLETITLLLSLLVTSPDSIFLLRGSSEESPVSILKGLRDEIISTYGDTSLWSQFLDIFSYLPYAAIASEQVLLTSPFVIGRIQTLNDISSMEIPSCATSIDPAVPFYSYSSLDANIDETKAFDLMMASHLSCIVCGDYQGEAGSTCYCNNRVISFTSSYSDSDNILIYLDGCKDLTSITFHVGEATPRSEAKFSSTEYPGAAGNLRVSMSCQARKPKIAIPMVGTRSGLTPKVSGARTALASCEITPVPSRSIHLLPNGQTL